jgi:hypothetical protein
MEKSNHQQTIVLCHDHVYFGGMQLTYRFSVLPGEMVHRYFISISLEGETCEAEAGNDLIHALGHYRRIREGYVTPCGLDDVMQELHYAS